MHRRQPLKLAWSLVLLAMPVVTHADSDLELTCGPEFAVFDRLISNGRTLNVVPLGDDGELTVVATIQMPPGQPHVWAIHDRHVVVRMWNDFYVYRLDQALRPELVASAQIDRQRSNVGGTTAIRLSGSVLTVYGINATLRLDLATCVQACEPRQTPTETPPAAAASQRCSVKRGDVLFAESVATTRGDKALYHDVFLTRRRTTSIGVRLVDDPFRPTSVLYLGTRLETVD